MEISLQAMGAATAGLCLLPGWNTGQNAESLRNGMLYTGPIWEK